MSDLQTLAAAIWLFMVGVVPPGDQTRAWREPEQDAADRYWDIANTIADVALDDDEEPLPPPDAETDAREWTAFLLASIASYESFFAKSVSECKTLGPNGAKGLYQCEGKCPHVCDDLDHSTRLALGMVRDSFRVCAKMPLLDRLGRYTDGKCIRDWSRSRWRVGRALREIKSGSLFLDWD